MVAKNFTKSYSYKSQLKVFKLFLSFLLNGPHKTTFGIFEILKIEISTFYFYLFIFFGVFLNMEPNESEKFKTPLLLQIGA